MPRFLSVDTLAPSIRKFVDENAKICQPSSIYVCDGSEEENSRLIGKLEDTGRLVKLTKYDNWYVEKHARKMMLVPV